jgi:hypothetical protein
VGFYSPCTSTHSRLLCLTPMIDEDDFWKIGGMKTGWGNRSTRRKPTPAPLCPPQNPTWQTRSRTPDRSGGKPATNRLSYGVARPIFSPISSPLTTHRVTVEVFDPASTRVLFAPCSICSLWSLMNHSLHLPASGPSHLFPALWLTFKNFLNHSCFIHSHHMPTTSPDFFF